MPASPRGLYEVLITAALEAELQDAGKRHEVRRDGLREAEAAERIAFHVGRVVERAVASFTRDERVEKGIALARQLINEIATAVAEAAGDEKPVTPGAVLRAVLARLPDSSPETISEPLIPLLDTTLLTNAPGEPRVGSQLLTEIHSADRIDVVMAFIRRSRIAPLLDALRRHCHAGRGLRVLTTTYTGSTEAKALDLLCAAGAEVRISYDTTTTRLHAKAWLFHRRTGFSTAYIGSSNLTRR